jgi:hypothetical protein
LDSSADSSSSTAAQEPAGSTQNLLGSLFDSLQQIIGARAIPTAAKAGAAVAASANAAAGGAAAGTAAAAGSKINVTA